MTVTDPATAASMAQGRSEAVSKYLHNSGEAQNDRVWWDQADRILGYRRGPYHEADYQKLVRMRHVADDNTLDRYFRLGRAPIEPADRTSLAQFMFPDERLAMGQAPVYPPALNDYLLHRIHGYPWGPLPEFFDPVAELRERYQMTYAQAKMALHETYLDYQRGVPP